MKLHVAGHLLRVSFYPLHRAVVTGPPQGKRRVCRQLRLGLTWAGRPCLCDLVGRVRGVSCANWGEPSTPHPLSLSPLLSHCLLPGGVGVGRLEGFQI